MFMDPQKQIPKITVDVRRRFFTKFNKSKGCWAWLKGKQNYSYGVFTISGRDYLAHRISWTIFKGEIPVKLQVLHKCDNPPCVNPKHLWLGSQLDNMHDRNIKGRGNNCHGEKHGRAKLSVKDVKFIRSIYKTRTVTQKTLAKKFKVNQTTISHVIIKRNWKNLK